MTQRKEKPDLKTIVPVDNLRQINLHAAGLDIGAEEIYACVPADRDEQFVRVFLTFTADLHALADWLTSCGIKSVAMESTGVYWIPVYEILEAKGFEVCLVNARHLKNVAQKKTDVLDCQWLQQLHTYGLLHGSFRPAEEICALRALARHRENLVRYRSAHIQHMQKALQMMNLRLTGVVSDITGLTGLRIIRTILAGEHDPHRLASLRDPKCAKCEEEIARALQGNYKAEHLFVLKQALAQYDFYDGQIRECDAEMEKLYASFTPTEKDDQGESSPPAAKRHKPRKNEAHFDLATALYRTVGVDLTAIPGIDALTAQKVISEIGLDMSPWPTVKHFTSWLGLAPNTKKSGGKVLSSHTNKTQNRANTALRIAAQTLSHSHSALGGFYRRMRAKVGAAQANVATAHKLARIIYHLLKYRKAYADPGEDYYEQRYQEHAIRNLKRKAAAFGLELVPAAPQPSLVS